MKVRIPNASNSTKCPKCSKLMKSYWWGVRCPQCNHQQLNNEGREWERQMRRVESIED